MNEGCMLVPSIHSNNRNCCNKSCTLRLSACGRYACAKPLLLRNTRLFNRNNSCTLRLSACGRYAYAKPLLLTQYAAFLKEQFAYAPAISMRAVLPQCIGERHTKIPRYYEFGEL